MTDRLLTDAEVASFLGVSKATVWRHAAKGSLPKPVKLGHASRWPESDVQAAVDQLKAQRDSEAA
ncbi:AlpA family transcriptional regulator [Ruegeria sp. AU67]|uniref:helix-turn-helix transcriptional regulator n=1 Tax=Ruegeria sp. AU67 TaxID=2108530 RepID=UPI000D68DA84|nr:AlpA family transcriptional regulator [Ruegeria sp. AU67]